MATLIKNVRVIDCFLGIDSKEDVFIDDNCIDLAPEKINKKVQTIDGKNKVLIPGLIDLHVHFREPGFIHKEDIASGIKAALAGGVTSALVMPNTLPAVDQFKRVKYQLDRAKKYSYDLMVASAASIDLKGKSITDIKNLKRAGAKAVTDDGRPILDDGLMENVLKQCRLYDLVCMQHAEDLRLSKGASINDGKISKQIGMTGQSRLAESNLIARDLEFALKINARYHVLHLSCSESLQLVKKAKQKSKLISCEVAPHHLLFTEREVLGLNTLKKMNPPLRCKEDVNALMEGLVDGSIDAVASDHAPHSIKEKKLPFLTSPFGVVGVESSILALLTLVKKQDLPLMRAIELMTVGPARILGESGRIGTFIGDRAEKNAVLLDLDFKRMFSQRDLHSRSKNSAFLGMEMYGRVLMTFLKGKVVYSVF